MLMMRDMRKILLSLIALGGLGLGGCYVEDSYATGPGYATTYAAPAPGYSEPEMVDVSPGVQVVYDYDYPVFFTGGFYWRWYGGGWYSSHYYNGGWGVAVAANVPVGIRGISNPGVYAHYRPAGYVPRAYRPGGANYRGGAAVGARGYVGPNRTATPASHPATARPATVNHTSSGHHGK